MAPAEHSSTDANQRKTFAVAWNQGTKLVPIEVIDPTHTITMNESMMAYSIAVGPLSSSNNCANRAYKLFIAEPQW
jgi:hypothetical protein